MKFIKLIILLLSSITILNSCSGFSEAGKVLRGDKVNNTDEFLIKKNEPLTQPPEFEEIPAPRSLEDKNKAEKKDIENILKNTNPDTTSNRTKSTSTEKSILEQIKK
jgi:hypothetical protein